MTTPPLALRLLAYAPNGGPLGPLPYPADLAAGLPLNDVGALTLTYSTVHPGGSLVARALSQGLEVAVQVDHGSGWVEPDSARYLLIGRSGDAADETGTHRLTCPGYAWQLGKVRMHSGSGLTEDGRRFFGTVTAGFTMKLLIDEAKARGALPGLTYDFTATHDSAGQPWAGTASFRPEIGTDALTVLNSLVGHGLAEWTMAGRTLRLFNPGTALARDRWATARVAVKVRRDVEQAPTSETIEDLASAVLVRAADGVLASTTSGTAPSPWGRWEALLDAPAITTSADATLVGQAHLAGVGRVRSQLTRSLVLETARWLPVRDYRPGDYVGVPEAGTAALRVHQVTLTRDSDGRTGGNVIVGDKFVDADLRARRRQIEMSLSLRGRATRSPATPATPGLTGSGTATRVTATGRNTGRVTLSWGAVSQATNGATIQVAKYEIRARRSSADPWVEVGSVAGDVTTFVHDNLEPGDTWQYGVVAVSTSGGRSDLGILGATPTVPADTTAPPVPTVPGVWSTLGQVTVSWDGSLMGPIPADFARVEVAYGSTSTPTQIFGSLVTAGTLTLPAEAPGTVVHVRLRAVDETGNASAWTAASSTTVTPPAADPSIADAFMELEGAVEGVRVSADGKNRITDATTPPVNPTWTVERTNWARNPVAAVDLATVGAYSNAVASVGRQTGITGLPSGYTTAARLTTLASGTQQGVGWDVLIEPLTTYTVTARVRRLSGSDPFALAMASVGVGPNLTLPTMEWVTATWTVTTPALASAIDRKVGIRAASVTGENIIDVSMMQVEKSSTTAPFFDGSSAPTPGIRYAWTGTPHASTSQRLVSPGAPTGGDTHFVWSGGNITQHWTYNGATGVWEQRQYGHQVMASLDLGKATVGELDGQRIKAGTIGTPQLRVGAFNLIADPLFQVEAIRAVRAAQSGVSFLQDANAKDGQWYARVLASPGAPASFYTHADASDLYSLPVIPGERYRFGAWVRNAPGAPSNVGFRPVMLTKSASGNTSLASFAGWFTPQAAPASWTYYEWEYTAGSGAVSVQPGFITGDGIGGVLVSHLTFQQKAVGSLIVDGSVAAKHLAAEIVLASTSIIAGTPGGARTELTPTGLRKYAANGTSVLFDLAGANAIFRGNVEGASITGGTFRTASTGTRVEMTQGDAGAVQFWHGDVSGSPIADVSMGVDFTGTRALLVGARQGQAANASLLGDNVSAFARLGDVVLRANGGGGGLTGAVAIVGSGGLYAQNVYDATTTSAVNVHVGSDGRLRRSTSAARYKLDTRPVADDAADRVLDLAVQTWIDKGEADTRAANAQGKGKADPPPLRRIPGLVAEDVAAAGLTEFVVYGDDGQVEGLMYDRLALLLIPAVKRLRDRVAALEGRGAPGQPSTPGKGTTR